jgi:hypothetical protein
MADDLRPAVIQAITSPGTSTLLFSALLQSYVREPALQKQLHCCTCCKPGLQQLLYCRIVGKPSDCSFRFPSRNLMCAYVSRCIAKHFCTPLCCHIVLQAWHTFCKTSIYKTTLNCSQTWHSNTNVPSHLFENLANYWTVMISAAWSSQTAVMSNFQA